MKYTIIGDPHAKPSNLDKIEKLFNLIEEHGNPTIFLGDFLDTKEVIRGSCLNLVYNRLKSSKLFHYIIVGNHDYFNLECKDHTLEVLKELPNVKIIDELLHVEGLGYLIPYIHDMQKLRDTLNLIPENSVVFAHLDISGFDYGNGHLCDSGISLKDLKKFKVVMSGHFHKYQHTGNVFYLGTPFSHSFGESNQDKWIAEYESNTNELLLMPTLLPRHVTVTLDCDKDQQDFKFRRPVFEGSPDIIRVILTGNKDNIAKYRNLPVLQQANQILERPTDTNINKITVDESQDNETKFSQWSTNIQKWDSETIKLGLEILKMVKK